MVLRRRYVRGEDGAPRLVHGRLGKDQCLIDGLTGEVYEKAWVGRTAEEAAALPRPHYCDGRPVPRWEINPPTETPPLGSTIYVGARAGFAGGRATVGALRLRRSADPWTYHWCVRTLEDPAIEHAWPLLARAQALLEAHFGDAVVRRLRVD